VQSIQPNVNTRRLVVEEGGFQYDSDSYAEDLPYWSMDYGETPHLVIPYTLTENDVGFVTPNGFSSGAQFCEHLKGTLRDLIEEGKNGTPKMMTVALHCRLARPGRVSGLAEFLDYAISYKKEVWIATRQQIADFWKKNHFPLGGGAPVKPWYLNDNNIPALSTLESIRGSLPKMPTFRKPANPKEALGEGDVI
jgi:allantoinase